MDRGGGGLPGVETSDVYPPRNPYMTDPAYPPPISRLPAPSYDPGPQHVAPPAYDDIFPPVSQGGNNLVPAAPVYVEPAPTAQPSAPPDSRPTTTAAINAYFNPPENPGFLPSGSSGQADILTLEPIPRRLDPIRPKESTPPAPAPAPPAPPAAPAPAPAPAAPAPAPAAPAPKPKTTGASGGASGGASTSTRQQPVRERREYDYGQLDKYDCYCETFKCWPCHPPNNTPKLCAYDKKSACHWRIFCLIVLLFCVIFFPVYFTWPPCDYQCEDTNKCIESYKVCDGIKQCKNDDDENECKPRIRSLSAYVVGELGSTVTMECRAVRGSDVLYWYYIDSNSAAATYIWNSDTGNRLSGYDVNRRRARYNLDIFGVEADHANLTYAVGFQTAVPRKFARLIVIQSVDCSPVSSINVAEGDAISLNVIVQYYGDTEPLVLWFHNTAQLTSETSSTTSGNQHTLTVTYTSEARVEHNGTTFSAYVPRKFRRRTLDSPPSNNVASCHVAVGVLYSPRDVHFDFTSSTSEAIALYPGNTLYCLAKANPQPSYNIDCNSGAYTVQDSAFTIPEGVPQTMSCICTVSNEIDGETHTASATVVFETLHSAGVRPESFWLPLILLLLTTQIM